MTRTTAAPVTTAPVTTAPPSPVRPSSSLLMGEPGAGKTTSLMTYAHAGLTLVAVITEPRGEEALLDAAIRADVMDHLHYACVPFASTNWQTMLDMAKKISQFGYDDLSRLKSGMSKDGYRQYYTLLETLSDFKCQRTGRHIGPVDNLDDNYAFVLDSASGLNQMCKDLVVGSKPTMHEGEWGVAMNAEERLINLLNSNLKCFYTLTAHVIKQQSEITGERLITPAFLGQKLAPVLPRMFGDIILARREGERFYWSTLAAGVATKNRTLPLADNLEPSFVPIVERYRARKAAAMATTATN